MAPKIRTKTESFILKHHSGCPYMRNTHLIMSFEASCDNLNTFNIQTEIYSNIQFLFKNVIALFNNNIV